MSRIIGVTVGTPTSPAKMDEELKPVKTINGIAPDENGNVEVEVGSGGDLNVTDDGNGNVILENVPTTDGDFIVEQGRSDNGWDYRKWNSGRAECWKNVTATVKTTDWKDSGMMSFPLLSGFGLFWTSGISIELAYPFAFTEHPVETAIMSNGTAWLPLTLISTTHLQKDKTDSYRLCTYKIPEKDINVKIAFSVVGKWK